MRFVAVCLLSAALAAPVFAATQSDDSSPKTKASSFAPHRVPASRSYGMPIQSQILHKRVHKKPAAANPT
jgi:hypothetical protein